MLLLYVITIKFMIKTKKHCNVPSRLPYSFKDYNMYNHVQHYSYFISIGFVFCFSLNSFCLKGTFKLAFWDTPKTPILWQNGICVHACFLVSRLVDVTSHTLLICCWINTLLQLVTWSIISAFVAWSHANNSGTVKVIS